MPLTPGLRKIALTAHILSSIGWLGAVASFLALAIAGLASRNFPLVRAVYSVMGLLGWFVIVPFCVASLVSGIVLSLGTAWGLFRHYWVLVKFLMTVPATLILLLHMQPISEIAGIAQTKGLAPRDLLELRSQILVQTVAALAVLLIATVLSVYKPRGLTSYGQRTEAP